MKDRPVVFKLVRYGAFDEVSCVSSRFSIMTTTTGGSIGAPTARGAPPTLDNVSIRAIVSPVANPRMSGLPRMANGWWHRDRAAEQPPKVHTTSC